MPVERREMSVSQFCELLALDPARFIGVENVVEQPGTRKVRKAIVIVLEPEDADDRNLPPVVG